ncbi:hypothetical protein O0I10_007154 [Lichtheimia ornata]|uniref:Uncharacterized protein n=1 Tax=Lichtheimia ornata TaxID=688661 RepID=A0AAD7V1I7_9FUNG|nr:uncharacterized protein O0I10_007154 [Lichtheimia ornata]KAJ8657074.1 hypothetical protein O0I10_007154 [Lichtheimia ornata]
MVLVTTYWILPFICICNNKQQLVYLLVSPSLISSQFGSSCRQSFRWISHYTHACCRWTISAQATKFLSLLSTAFTRSSGGSRYLAN